MPKVALAEEVARRERGPPAMTGLSHFVRFACDSCRCGTLWQGYCPNPQMPTETVTREGKPMQSLRVGLAERTFLIAREHENGLWGV